MRHLKTRKGESVTESRGQWGRLCVLLVASEALQWPWRRGQVCVREAGQGLRERATTAPQRDGRGSVLVLWDKRLGLQKEQGLGDNCEPFTVTLPISVRWPCRAVAAVRRQLLEA